MIASMHVVRRPATTPRTLPGWASFLPLLAGGAAALGCIAAFAASGPIFQGMLVRVLVDLAPMAALTVTIVALLGAGCAAIQGRTVSGVVRIGALAGFALGATTLAFVWLTSAATTFHWAAAVTLIAAIAQVALTAAISAYLCLTLWRYHPLASAA